MRPAINYFFQVGQGGGIKQDEADEPTQSSTASSGSESSPSSLDADDSDFGGVDTEDDARLYPFIPQRLRPEIVERAHVAPEMPPPRDVRLQASSSPDSTSILVYDSKVDDSDTARDKYTAELGIRDVATSLKEPLFQWM